jgi:hypothetical protein
VLMHKLSKPKVTKRKVKVAGPYDVVGGDVDLLRPATYHRHSWRQLCYGPRDGKGHKFESLELEREESARTSGMKIP